MHDFFFLDVSALLVMTRKNHDDDAAYPYPFLPPAPNHLSAAPFRTRCTIMFWNERLGEFAQEVKVSVNLPLPMAKLPLRVTAKDGSGGSGEAVQRELLLPSKNLALQNALLGILLER